MVKNILRFKMGEQRVLSQLSNSKCKGGGSHIYILDKRRLKAWAARSSLPYSQGRRDCGVVMESIVQQWILYIISKGVEFRVSFLTQARKTHILTA